VECNRYHSRLAELVAIKNHVMDQSKSVFCAAEISITLLGSRASRRVHLQLSDFDLDIEKGHANIR